MPPDLPRVVVAGGGVAALEAVLALLDRAPRLPVQLVAADTHFFNRPLSVLEPFHAGGARAIPLDVLRDRGVTVTQGRVTSVDPRRRTLVTGDGIERPYDALVVALGARAVRPFDGALAFRGGRDADAFHALLEDVEAGQARRLAFVAPATATWLLPLYELALQTAARARELLLDDVQLTLTTPERRPLEIFGRTGSALLECLLEEAGIELVCGASGAPELAADRVVTLPRLEGPALFGLPRDGGGFVPVDRHARVVGVDRVYAAGDGTDRPVKQGGLAAQQADAAVDALLADLGVAEAPEPAPPCLRAVLVTGDEVWYLRRTEGDADGEVSRRPLWWPPGKLAGRHLAPWLDDQAEATPGSADRRLARAHGIRRRAAIVRGGDGHAAMQPLAWGA